MIIASRTLTEPKAALARVILESSLARFKPSIATLSDEVAPSLALDRSSDLVCMVKTERDHEGAVRRIDCEALRHDGGGQPFRKFP